MDPDSELLMRVKHLEDALDEIKRIMRERDKEWRRGFWYRFVKTMRRLFLGL